MQWFHEAMTHAVTCAGRTLQLNPRLLWNTPLLEQFDDRRMAGGRSEASVARN
jgi:hypothetical protein